MVRSLVKKQLALHDGVEERAETVVVFGRGANDRIDGFAVGEFHGVAGAVGDELFGEAFHDIDEFKRHILARPEPIVRGLTEKLVTYGTGHAVEFADRETIDAIVRAAAKNHYGFRSLLHAVVQSDLFLNK